jgi:regulator of RNase E activity RraB
MAEIDGDPASISLDLGASEHVPVEDHPLRLALRIAMKRPRPDGLRSSEEFDALSAIEDRLVESIGHEIEGWFVGRVLYRGSSDMFFYLPRPQRDDEERLSSCVEAAAGDYEITQRIDDDPKWDFYTDFLWPDRASHQAMGNRRVLAQLEQAGDDHELVRAVDHFAFFQDEKACRRFADRLREHGFTVEEPEHGEHGAWALKFQRDDTLADGRIDEITTEILELMGDDDGDYDGWGCSVCARD